MGNTIRVLLEYQYNDGQGTATGELNFIDDYFNNADGKVHVSNPHPVSYFIWGGGGAAYYSGANTQGTQPAIVPDRSRPREPGACLGLGRGGPFRHGMELHRQFRDCFRRHESLPRLKRGPGHAPGDPARTIRTRLLLHRRRPATSASINLAAGLPRVTIWLTRCISFAPATRRQVASVVIDTSKGTAGQYAYAALSTPVVLKAGTTYYLVSEETSGQDPFYGQDTTIKPNSSSGVTINGATSATYAGQPGNTTSWIFTPGTAGATRSARSISNPPPRESGPSGTSRTPPKARRLSS